MTLVKFPNANDRKAVNPWFNDVFESIFNDSFMSDRLVTRVPAVNISEDEQAFEVELAVPGLQKEDFKISLNKNVLSISAEKQQETKDKKFNRREFSYHSFVRSFTLPESADQANIEAEYANGILKLRVAKKEEARMLSREISVK